MWTLKNKDVEHCYCYWKLFLFHLPFSVTVVDMLAVRTSSDSLKNNNANMSC